MDYIYLALGILSGILIGKIPLSVAGIKIEMRLGGGCLVSLISSMLYVRFVIKMNPVLFAEELAGLLTCTLTLNAAVTEADSEMPVLGYTAPYTISNILLTLLGPVILLCV